MNENIEALNAKIDTLTIESALNSVELQQLTILVFELLHRLPKGDQATRLKIEHAEALMSEKTEKLSRLEGQVDTVDLTRVKFEVHSFYSGLISSLKKELENS